MSQFMLKGQEIIYDALNGNISATVYDFVPDQDPGKPDDHFPYVVIGRDQSFAFDTDNWNGENITVEINVWSSYKGKKETKEIMAEIDALLHKQSLSASGVNVLDCLRTYAVIPNTGASNYTNGICRYRLTLTEVI